MILTLEPSLMLLKTQLELILHNIQDCSHDHKTDTCGVEFIYKEYQETKLNHFCILFWVIFFAKKIMMFLNVNKTVWLGILSDI